MTEEQFEALVVFVRSMVQLAVHASKHGSASPHAEEQIIEDAKRALVVDPYGELEG